MMSCNGQMMDDTKNFLILADIKLLEMKKFLVSDQICFKNVKNFTTKFEFLQLP